MKFLIIIVICVAVANVQAIQVFQELLTYALKECKVEVQATQEDLMEVLQHKAPTTASGKCLVTCLNKKFKVQTASGEIDAKATKETLKLTKFLSEEIYQELIGIVDTCLGQVHTGDNECDIGSSFFVCLINGITASKLPVMLVDLVL